MRSTLIIRANCRGGLIAAQRADHRECEQSHRPCAGAFARGLHPCPRGCEPDRR